MPPPDAPAPRPTPSVQAILVVVRTCEPHRQAEALRAALGLTLRGAHVTVVVDDPLATALARRAAETLRAFGHIVGPASGEPRGAGRARAGRRGGGAGRRWGPGWGRATRQDVPPDG